VLVAANSNTFRVRATFVFAKCGTRTFSTELATLKRQRPRPLLNDVDRAFWVALRASWPGWVSCLLIVDPNTVAKWNRERFRRYWTKLSHQNRRPGRPRIDLELRRLILLMARDGWGAPRIHGELLMLGFEISEVTVSRYMPRRPVEPDKVKRWMAFLRNHKDAIAARDFFTVPTASFRVLYVLFVIEHGRRRVRHFNVTSNPTSERPIAAPGKMQSPSAGSEVVGESSLSKL